MWQSEYVDNFIGTQHVRNITDEMCGRDFADGTSPPSPLQMPSLTDG